MNRVAVLLALGVSVACAACAEEDAGPIRAGGSFAPKSGNMTLAGTARFLLEDGKVTATVEVKGAPPGQHGVHIHQMGDCSAMDAMTAGGHWDPDMVKHMHGMGAASTSHLGDMGNLTVGADGAGTLVLSNPQWTLGNMGPHDVVGKAVIVHELVDDYTDVMNGNAGGRIGCAVIAK